MPCWLVVWLNELLVIVVDEFLCWKLWEVLKEIGPRDLNNFFTRRQVLSSSFSCVWKNMTRTYHMYMHSRSLQSTIHCPMRHTLPPRFLNGREARHAITLDFYCICIDIFYHHDIDLCNILWSIITLLLTVLKQISSMNNIVIRMRREWVVESYLYRDTHRLNTLSTTQQAAGTAVANAVQEPGVYVLCVIIHFAGSIIIISISSRWSLLRPKSVFNMDRFHHEFILEWVIIKFILPNQGATSQRCPCITPAFIASWLGK